MKNNVFTAKNTFRDGMVSDLAPDNTLPNCLTSALNATFLTYNGNELSLQNDMGNARVHSAFLPEGYIPLGSTEFGGIIYVASYNPETNKCLIGSFPSPLRTTYSELKSSTQTAINESDFISDKLMIATEKLYELTNFSLFPGDLFLLIGENIKNNKTNLYDFNNDKDGPLHLSVIIKNDLGELEELEVSEKSFDGNCYIIPEKKTNQNDELDLDYYRNLVNGFDTISSKISGKLYLKAELVVIDKFLVNITKYETVGPDLNITLELKSSSEKFEGIYAHQYKINDETIDNKPENGEYFSSLTYTLTIKDYKNLTTIDFTIQPIMWGYVIPNLEITKSLNVKSIGTGELEISQWRYWNDNNISLYFGLEYYPEPNKEINDITISFIPYESLTDESVLKDVDEFGVNKHSEFNLHYDEVSNYIEEIEYNTLLKKDYLYLAEILALESDKDDHINKRFLYRWVYTNQIFNNEFTNNLDFNTLSPQLKLDIDLNVSKSLFNTTFGSWKDSDLENNLLKYRNNIYTQNINFDPKVVLNNSYNFFNLTNNITNLTLNVENSYMNIPNLEVMNSGENNVLDYYRLLFINNSGINKNVTSELNENEITFKYTINEPYLFLKGSGYIKLYILKPLVYNKETLNKYGMKISNTNEDIKEYQPFFKIPAFSYGYGSNDCGSTELMVFDCKNTTNFIISSRYIYNYNYWYYSPFTLLYQNATSSTEHNTSDGTSYWNYLKDESDYKYLTIFPLIYKGGGSVGENLSWHNTYNLGIFYKNSTPNLFFYIPPFYKNWTENWSYANYNNLLFEHSSESLGRISDIQLKLSAFTGGVIESNDYKYPTLCGIGMLDINNKIIPLNVFAYLLAKENSFMLIHSRSKYDKNSGETPLPIYKDDDFNLIALQGTEEDSKQSGISIMTPVLSLLTLVLKVEKDDLIFKQDIITDILALKNYILEFIHDIKISTINEPSISNFNEIIDVCNNKINISNISPDIVNSNYFIKLLNINIPVENNLIEMLRFMSKYESIVEFAMMDLNNDLLITTYNNLEPEYNKLYCVNLYTNDSLLLSIENLKLIDYVPKINYIDDYDNFYTQIPESETFEYSKILNIDNKFVYKEIKNSINIPFPGKEDSTVNINVSITKSDEPSTSLNNVIITISNDNLADLLSTYQLWKNIYGDNTKTNVNFETTGLYENSGEILQLNITNEVLDDNNYVKVTINKLDNCTYKIKYMSYLDEQEIIQEISSTIFIPCGYLILSITETDITTETETELKLSFDSENYKSGYLKRNDDTEIGQVISNRGSLLNGIELDLLFTTINLATINLSSQLQCNVKDENITINHIRYTPIDEIKSNCTLTISMQSEVTYPTINTIGKYLTLNKDGLLVLKDMSYYIGNLYFIQCGSLAGLEGHKYFGTTIPSKLESEDVVAWEYLQDLKLRNEYAV